LVAEINSVIQSDADITVDNFKKLNYLNCVITETSRMYSSSGGIFDRIASEDMEMFGIGVKKGTLVGACWIAHLRSPDYFEQPHEFIPERWEKEEAKNYQQLIDLTFSGGPRGCIGKNLALTESRVMMIKFLKRYGSLVEPGIKERAYRMLLTIHIPNSEVVLTRSA
jgi:cytochrome P450